MRISLAFGIASILAASVPCVAAQNSAATEGLCLLQTKAAKHGRNHHTHETPLSDIDTSAPDAETATKEKAVLLSSSPGAESSHSDGLASDEKPQGITDLEAYGGSMMDLVLGGWRHNHEETSSKKPSAGSYVHMPSVAPDHDSSSKDVVDAFGDPIRDMDIDLLSTSPARVRVEPILEDTPPFEFAESGSSDEPADKVLADAQKSLEAYSAVLSDTEQISLLGQTADESESHHTQQDSKTQRSHSHQHHESAANSASAQHVVEHKHAAVQEKVPATEHVTTRKHAVLVPTTDSSLSDDKAHVVKDKFATASVKQAVHQKRPVLATIQ